VTLDSLRLEVPTLVPDDAFVRRLAALAAASEASPGVVVPAAFGGPATRAVAAAAAVAAITAGAAAAATRINHTHHPSPAPSFTTHDTRSPQSTPTSDPPDSGRTQAADDPTRGPGRENSTPVVAQPTAVHTAAPPPVESTPSGPETHDPGDGDHHGHDGDHHGSNDGVGNDGGGNDGGSNDGGGPGGGPGDGSSDGATSGVLTGQGD
jgi:hypothetical protein